jgi:hypothetical protein
MKFIETVSEDYMISAFVAGEIDSPRFGKSYKVGLRSLGVGRSIVDSPNLDDTGENAICRHLLTCCRGYPNLLLFAGVPIDVMWHRASLPIGEVGELRYAQYPTWTKLSAGTRLIRDGAANIDTIPTAEGANVQIKELARAMMANDDLRLGELVLAATDMQGPFAIVEGHTRATAYALIGPRKLASLPVVVGISAHMSSWHFFDVDTLHTPGNAHC